MKRVIFLFAFCLSLLLAVDNKKPDGFVKEKTEQSAAMVTATTSALL